MCWRSCLLALALAGCDAVFGLELQPLDAAIIDAAVVSDAAVVVDAPPEVAPACWTSPAYQFVGVIPGSKYRASSSSLAWGDAKAACDADGPGAHLAVITHAEAELSIVAMSALTSDRVWIGLDDLTTEGTWVSQTLEPVPTPPTPLWRMNEPNNSGTAGVLGEDCAVLFEEGLNDGGCQLLHRALCECELPVTCNDPAGTLTVLPGPFATLEEARDACAQMQRKLVVISTPDELEAVRLAVAGAAPGFAWIDLEAPAPRDWRTRSGCRPYLRWAHVIAFDPEPNGGPGEACGAMSIDGVVDLACTGRLEAAVCEAP